MIDRMIGKYCMVRTHSAGVFAGTVEQIDGRTALLSKARRIWYWEGAASLSQLATNGTTSPRRCKFPVPVDEVLLFDVIEIIPITPEAAASINEVPVWRI